MNPHLFDTDGLSMQARIVWLFLRDEGGWWTAPELRAELLPGVAPVQAAGAMTHALRALMLRGHVVLRQEPVRSYGVTSACLPVLGCSLMPGAAAPACPDFPSV